MGCCIARANNTALVIIWEAFGRLPDIFLERKLQMAERTLSRGETHALRLLREEHRAGQKRTPAFGNLTNQNLKDNTQYDRDWFTYVFPIGSLTTLAVSNQVINVQADSAFELMQITGSANLNGQTEPWSINSQLPFTIFITDTGTSRNLMSAPLPLSMVCGSGNLPFILPQDRIFMPKSTIQIQVTSISPSTWNNIYIGFSGAKLFEYT